MQKIASALVKAQRAFGPALKTNSNPHFRSRYADLAACVDAVMEALNDNGIFLMQGTHEDSTGVTVETIFIHESGEQISAGKFHVPATKQDAQGYGSAATYARRYSLMAACGIAPEDDDGNSASKRGSLPATVRSSPTQGAMEEVQDDERRLYLQALGSVLDNLVTKGDVDTAYKRLLREKLDDTEYTALWECLKSKPGVRAALKKHADEIKAAVKAQKETA